MSRMIGTVSRGVRAPIIRSGDNLVQIVTNSILEAAKKHDVNVDFNSYNASTGVFSITASSPEVEDINQFIADLMAMDIFENVNYTGYSLSSDGKSWQINVVCTLAGREPAAEEVN